MRKNKDPDIIELTTKKPVFSWAIVFVFIAAWVVTLVLAIVMRASVVRLLLPLIAALFVIYLGVCTVLCLKNKK